jgi:protein subunit release factor A
LEEEIAKLEKELETLNARLEDSSIQSNFEELSAIQKEIDEKDGAIMVKYEMWEKLQ